MINPDWVDLGNPKNPATSSDWHPSYESIHRHHWHDLARTSPYTWTKEGVESQTWPLGPKHPPKRKAKHLPSSFFKGSTGVISVNFSEKGARNISFSLGRWYGIPVLRLMNLKFEEKPSVASWNNSACRHNKYNEWWWMKQWQLCTKNPLKHQESGTLQEL